MSIAFLEGVEYDEAQPPRGWGGKRPRSGPKSGKPNPNAGRKQRKTLLINGVLQEGHYKIVEANKDTIIIESV